MRVRTFFALAGCAAALSVGIVACGSQPSTPQGPSIENSVAVSDRVRLFIGQDVTSTTAYANDVGKPAGIVSYTSVASLEGLDRQADQGGGPMHLDALAATYPGAPISVGLYMVGAIAAIAEGTYDDNIDKLARVLDGYGVRVLLRIGYEFDGPWNNYKPPSDYVAAYKRIADRIRAAGAANVEMVWQASLRCESADRMPFYPGDSYVDWFGLSYFDTVPCIEKEADAFVELARAHGKPMFVAEATARGFDFSAMTYSPYPDGSRSEAITAEDAWTRWFVRYFAFVRNNRDVIRAATYINANWNSQGLWAPPYKNGYWGDTRVQVNPELLARWKAELGDEMWMTSP
jgi:hypothetical protein